MACCAVQLWTAQSRAAARQARWQQMQTMSSTGTVRLELMKLTPAGSLRRLVDLVLRLGGVYAIGTSPTATS
eukprot:10041169-Lingulodinium_polyedra.AAC.1